MERILLYLCGTKDNGLVFNPPKKLVVDFYADAYFAGLQGHANPQDPVCARSRTVFVVTFSNFHLLWVQNYRQGLLALHYIMIVWRCLML